jgi:hypothetical protein
MRRSGYHIAVLLAAGMAVVWLFWLRTGPPSPAPPAEPQGNPERTQPVLPLQKSSPGTLQPRHPVRPLPAASPAEEAAAEPGGGSTWRDTLENVLLSSEADEAKTQSLLELIPRAPESAQEEIAHHLVNLLGDDHYASAAILLTNVHTATNVLDVLINDLLNRPNAVKLPALVLIQAVDEHPKAAEARELLQHYLDQDYGSDDDAWERAVQDWLKAHEE